MTTIYYEVNGEPVRADECTWVFIAPCGCECGWSVAKYRPSEDEAWDGFSRSKAARQRDEKRGFRVEIKRHSDIRIKDDCPHTPKYGVEPRPEIDGHTWAAKQRARLLHLVPLVIEKGGYFSSREGTVRSMCGRADAYLWSTMHSDIDGRVECTACVKAANDGAA